MQTDSAEVAVAASRLFYLAAGLFPALLLLFSMVYPDTRKRPNILVFVLVSLAGLGIAGMTLFSPVFMVQSIVVEGAQKLVVIDPPTYGLYSIYFVSLFALAMAISLHRTLSTTGRLRMQAGLYALGILLNSVPGFIANLYLPFHGNYDYIWIGPAASVFFLALTTYGITKHQMFNIRAAAVRSTAYVFTLVTLVGIYYAIAFSLALVIPRAQVASVLNPITVLIALVLALVFQPVKRFFDQLTHRIFFRDFYTTEDFLIRITSIIASASDLRNLLSRVSYEIANTVKSEQVFFSISREVGQPLFVGTSHHGKLPPKDGGVLESHYAGGEGYVLRSQLNATNSLRRLLSSHNLEIIMPLFHGDVFIGHMCIGYHKTSRYSQQDIRALRALTDELAIAIENALAIERIKDLNAHLEQRINDATRELRRSNAQLQRLDEAKDEFISMASHQLRTPLTSIKGYISMLMDGDVGRVTPDQKHVLREVFVSSERMVRLIGDFLNVSRLQTGKFVIDKRPVDLAQLVKRELDGLASSASVRDMTFSYRPPKTIPVMNLDENKIQQVIMNFADNAIYYSKPNSTITVRLRKSGDTVEFTVKDTGIGVPEAEQVNLFSKFFRATNARRQRPDGTGVGLYLAKKVIHDHGGEVIFESEENKGSTFGFRLPLDKA